MRCHWKTFSFFSSQSSYDSALGNTSVLFRKSSFMYFSPLIFCKQTQTLIHALAILKIRHILSKVYKFMCLMATRFSSLFHPFYYFFLYKVKIDRKKIFYDQQQCSQQLVTLPTDTYWRQVLFFLSIYQLIFVNFVLTLNTQQPTQAPAVRKFIKQLWFKRERNEILLVVVQLLSCSYYFKIHSGHLSW